MTDKQIIEEDMVNAKDFCPHYPCQVDCYEARICPFFVETLQQLQVKEQENKDLREDIKDIAILLDLDTGEEYNFGNIELEIKQLQAKEQECEKIKNWVKGMMFYTDCSNWFERFTTAFEDWKNDLTSQLDQLKAENNELKRQLKVKSNVLKLTNEAKNNYKQTLQEIKEICNCNDELKGDFNVIDCDKYKYGKHNLATKILNKIKEMENGRN